MYRLEVLPIAKNDIDEILYYITYKLNNKTAVQKLNKKLKESFNNILGFPYGLSIYKTTKKLDNEYRSIKVKKYMIFYIIDEKNKVITIIRVLFNKMNFNSILN